MSDVININYIAILIRDSFINASVEKKKNHWKNSLK